MKLAIALDQPDTGASFSLAKNLARNLSAESQRDLAVKVGPAAFIPCGPVFVRNMLDLGFEVVLDLKFHDIPNTMALAARRAAELGVSMFTVHATAGKAAIKAAKKACLEFEKPPKVLAVTVLTSLSDDNCMQIYERSAEAVFRSLVFEAQLGGADGFVCGPADLLRLKGVSEQHVRFVPGIQIGVARGDDQRRTAGLREAVENGADYVVVGRPVYESDNPVETVNKILRKIHELTDLRAQYEAEATTW